MDDLTRALQAWHGSPHDFEEFRDDKIGTGEGTKAMGGYGVYGHGHYVAEERKVGEEYRDRLTAKRLLGNDQPVLFRGKHAGMVHDMLFSYARDLQRIKKEEEDLIDLKKVAQHPILINTAEEYLGRLKETLKNLKADIDGIFPEFNKLDSQVQDIVVDMFGQTVDKEPLTGYTRYLQRLQDHPNYAIGTPNRKILNKAHEFMLPFVKDFEGPSPPQGRLYELNLHVGPHELLDWDSILDEHHDDAIEKIANIPEIEGSYDGTQVGYATGEDLYRSLVKETGSAVKASNRLLEHGIRGIRYKDAGSRQAQILHLDGQPMDPFSNQYQTDPMFSAMFGSLAQDPVSNLDGLIQNLDSRSKGALHKERSQLLASARDWVTNNRDRLELKVKPPTYNYVIFDPTAIRIMRKLGMKGEVIKDFTDTGVHVKPRK